ncbi:DNA/RNA polymerase, partial [Zopfia rhizophila CBS 207.26]
SQSKIALPILFILKKNRKLRLCINYRYLNKAIIKNCYLILLILELIDKLRGITAFKIKYKLFKYLVILIELTNVLVIFQAIINHVLKEYLDVFIIAYFNNVLIYMNRTLKEYIKYTKKVLKKLKEYKLYI